MTDEYPEIVKQIGSDRVTARAHRAQTGSLSRPRDEAAIRAAEPCWLIELNSIQGPYSIPLIFGEDRTVLGVHFKTGH